MEARGPLKPAFIPSELGALIGSCPDDEHEPTYIKRVSRVPVESGLWRASVAVGRPIRGDCNNAGDDGGLHQGS